MRTLIKVLIALTLLAPAPAPAETIKLPDLTGSGMVIPWQDFKTLLELIQPREVKIEEEKEPPPAPYLITSADYQGSLVGDAAAFDFTIKLTVLEKKEWVLIPVLPRDLALEKVQLNGSPVLIVTRDNRHQVALQGAGDYTLTGRFYVSTGNRTGPRSVTAPLIPTPVTTLSFTVSEPGLELKAEPANLNRVINDEKSSRLISVLPPSSSVTISWSKKIEAEEAELRVNASVESLVTLGERLCQVSSIIHYEILHRGVTGFKLDLPKEAEVVDVSGAGVADWKTQKTGSGQILTVSLSFEAKGGYDLSVLYEVGLPDATAEVQVPVIAARDVARETGHLGVAARTNLEIEVKEFTNLAFIDMSELPPSLTGRSASPIIHAFKYVSQPWSLKLKTIKHKDVEVLTCTVDSLSLTSFMTRDGEVVTRATYTIRNNREQFIRITLPKGARVFSTFRDNQPIQPAEDEKGRLLVPLEKSAGASGRARAFTIEVTYLVQTDKLADKKGKLRLEAPQSDLMTNAMDWKVILPEDYEYEVIEKDTSLTAHELVYRPEERKKKIKKVSKKPSDELSNEQKAQLEALGYLSGEYDGSQSEKEMNVYFYHDLPIDAARKDARFRPSSSSQKQTYRVTRNVDLYDQNNISKTQGSRIRVSLPVRFLVPTQGAALDFDKTIIQENEPNNVTIKYKKVCDPLPTWKRNAIIIGAALALIILLWLLLRVRAKRRLAAKGVTP